jgi:outer membrane biosynthesis protein TonB
MFKKKMPRFGSSSIKMPRMPKPPKPRVKKFAEGGELDPMDDLAPRENLPSKEDLKPPKKPEPKPKPKPKPKQKPKSKDDMDDLTPYQNLPSPEDLLPPEPSKKYASGGSVSSASKRADGCATKGKTRGKFV